MVFKFNIGDLFYVKAKAELYYIYDYIYNTRTDNYSDYIATGYKLILMNSSKEIRIKKRYISETALHAKILDQVWIRYEAIR